MPPRLCRVICVLLTCLILDQPRQLHALDDIYIKTANHTGPMKEKSQYELQCDVINVAAGNLMVKWYKGDTEVFNETNVIIKGPVNITSTLTINANKDYNGVEYRCEAEGTATRALISKSLNIVVYYKPVITSYLESTVPVFRGYSLNLTCKADGNPKPNISWKTSTNLIVHGETLTITEAASQNAVCTASNSVGVATIAVKLILKEDYLPLIAGLVAITVAVISVIFIFIYSIYYKTAKMGHYSLKDAKPCAQNGNIAQNGKDSTIPMKKLSQSDILV